MDCKKLKAEFLNINFLRYMRLTLLLIQFPLFIVCAVAGSTADYFPVGSVIMSGIYNTVTIIAITLLAIFVTYNVLFMLVVPCAYWFGCKRCGPPPDNCRCLDWKNFALTLSVPIFVLTWCFECRCGCAMRGKIIIRSIMLAMYFLLFLSVFIAGGIDIQAANGQNKTISAVSMVCFFLNALIYLGFMAIEIFRIVQSRKIEMVLHDIISFDEPMSKRLKYVMTEQYLGSEVCPDGVNCRKLDVVHRAFCHSNDPYPKDHLVFDSNENNDANYIIGFHQTPIEFAILINRSFFIGSTEGWVGPGIYFANNYPATITKSDGKHGAIFCCKLKLNSLHSLKHADTIKNRVTRRFQGHDSIYFHQDEHSLDEIVLSSEDQILEYCMIIRRDHANEFKSKFDENLKKMNKKFLFFECCCQDNRVNTT